MVITTRISKGEKWFNGDHTPESEPGVKKEEKKYYEKRESSVKVESGGACMRNAKDEREKRGEVCFCLFEDGGGEKGKK
jgi:hypothetical protein